MTKTTNPSKTTTPTPDDDDEVLWGILNARDVLPPPPLPTTTTTPPSSRPRPRARARDAAARPAPWGDNPVAEFGARRARDSMAAAAYETPHYDAGDAFLSMMSVRIMSESDAKKRAGLKEALRLYRVTNEINSENSS